FAALRVVAGLRLAIELLDRSLAMDVADPFAHATRHVAHPVGRLVDRESTDGLGLVHDVPRIAREAKRRVEMVAPGQKAPIGAAGRLLPLRLARQADRGPLALAQPAAVGARVVPGGHVDGHAPEMAFFGREHLARFALDDEI